MEIRERMSYYDGSYSFVTNKIKDGYYQFKTKSLGKFYVDYDTIAPSIVRNKRVDYKKQIQYYIKDKETDEIQNQKPKNIYLKLHFF